MQESILIVYLVVAIALVGIILIQQGKGAEMGASFGAGGANTVFGAAGSGNALTRATTMLAILFFATALSISYLNSAPPAAIESVFDDAPVVEKVDIDSALPTSEADASGLEAELPKTEAVKTAIEEKASEVVIPTTEAASATEEKKKESGDQ
jgi:preprotein translocase subunit SecG